MTFAGLGATMWWDGEFRHWYSIPTMGDAMKLKHLAALLVLLTLGCAGDGTSTPATPEADASATSTAASTSEAPVADGLTKVSLAVTGMR